MTEEDQMNKPCAIVCCALIAAACTAAAVDLKNQDSSSYDIKIHDGPTTTSSTIEGNTTRVSICSDCKIEVVGVGEIEASGDVVVVIKDGKLAKE
jgi:hypothetical protein